MVGADKSTEPWWPPCNVMLVHVMLLGTRNLTNM